MTRSPRLGVAAALTVIVAAAIVMRFVFLAGLLGWDDVEYAAGADRLVRGEPPLTLFHVRYGVIVPLAIAQAILGHGESAWTAVMLAYSIAEIFLGYVIGTWAGGVRVGLAAAAVLAVLPLAVVSATEVHADLPAAVFMAAAFALVCRAEQSQRHATGLLVAAGAALGVAYVTKETSLVLLVVFGVRAALARSWRPLGWVGAGLVGIVLADLVLAYARSGDPLVRYAAALVDHHVVHMRTSAAGHDWLLDYPAMLLWPSAGYFGYFAGIAYLAIAAIVVVRSRAVVEVTAWWLSVLLVMNVVPLDGTFTRPLFFHFPRTLAPLLVPLAVSAGALLAWPRLATLLKIGLPAAFATLALAGTWATVEDHRAWSAVSRQAAAFIGQQPEPATIVSDRTTAAQLRALLPDPGARIATYDDGDLQDALVLVDPRFVQSDVATGRPVPRAVLDPPGDWVHVATFTRQGRPRLRALGEREPAEHAVLWRATAQVARR